MAPVLATPIAARAARRRAPSELFKDAAFRTDPNFGLRCSGCCRCCSIQVLDRAKHGPTAPPMTARRGGPAGTTSRTSRSSSSIDASVLEPAPVVLGFAEQAELDISLPCRYVLTGYPNDPESGRVMPTGHARQPGIREEDGTAMSASIRKIVTVVDETQIEGGRAVTPPTRRAAAIAVIENPFAGQYVENLDPLITIGEELGGLLAERAVAALGIPGDKALAAYVGAEGELGASPPRSCILAGAPFRKVLGKGAALILQEARRPRHTARYSVGHGDAARAQPFRRHGRCG